MRRLKTWIRELPPPLKDWSHLSRVDALGREHAKYAKLSMSASAAYRSHYSLSTGTRWRSLLLRLKSQSPAVFVNGMGYFLLSRKKAPMWCTVIMATTCSVENVSAALYHRYRSLSHEERRDAVKFVRQMTHLHSSWKVLQHNQLTLSTWTLATLIERGSRQDQVESCVTLLRYLVARNTPPALKTWTLVHAMMMRHLSWLPEHYFIWTMGWMLACPLGAWDVQCHTHQIIQGYLVFLSNKVLIARNKDEALDAGMVLKTSLQSLCRWQNQSDAKVPLPNGALNEKTLQWIYKAIYRLYSLPDNVVMFSDVGLQHVLVNGPTISKRLLSTLHWQCKNLVQVPSQWTSQLSSDLFLAFTHMRWSRLYQRSFKITDILQHGLLVHSGHIAPNPKSQVEVQFQSATENAQLEAAFLAFFAHRIKLSELAQRLKQVSRLVLDSSQTLLFILHVLKKEKLSQRLQVAPLLRTIYSESDPHAIWKVLRQMRIMPSFESSESILVNRILRIHNDNHQVMKSLFAYLKRYKPNPKSVCIDAIEEPFSSFLNSLTNRNTKPLVTVPIHVQYQRQSKLHDLSTTESDAVRGALWQWIEVGLESLNLHETLVDVSTQIRDIYLSRVL